MNRSAWRKSLGSIVPLEQKSFRNLASCCEKVLRRLIASFCPSNKMWGEGGRKFSRWEFEMNALFFAVLLIFSQYALEAYLSLKKEISSLSSPKSLCKQDGRLYMTSFAFEVIRPCWEWSKPKGKAYGRGKLFAVLQNRTFLLFGYCCKIQFKSQFSFLCCFAWNMNYSLEKEVLSQREDCLPRPSFLHSREEEVLRVPHMSRAWFHL